MTPAPDDLDAVCERVKAVLAKNPNASYFYTPSPSSIRANSAIIAADLRALLAQLEAAKRDSARIDWLENAAAHMHCNYSTPDAFTVGVDCTFLDGGFKVERHGLHLRDVIDSARLATKDAARTPSGAPENG